MCFSMVVIRNAVVLKLVSTEPTLVKLHTTRDRKTGRLYTGRTTVRYRLRANEQTH